MEAQYKRDLNHNYLVLLWKEMHQDYRIQMLQHQKTEELLPCMVRSMNQEMFFSYEISGKCSLKQYFDQKLMKADTLDRLMTTVSEAMEHMKEYLLDINMLVLEPEYIFVDLYTEQFSFCCFPGKEDSFFEEFHALCEYILGILDYREEQAVMLGYSLYRNTMQENFSLTQLLDQVKKQNKAIRQYKDYPAGQQYIGNIKDSASGQNESSVGGRDEILYTDSLPEQQYTSVAESPLEWKHAGAVEPLSGGRTAEYGTEQTTRTANAVQMRETTDDTAGRIQSGEIKKAEERSGTREAAQEEKRKKKTKKDGRKTDALQARQTADAAMKTDETDKAEKKDSGRFGEWLKKKKKDPEEYMMPSLASYANEEMFSYGGSQCMLQSTNRSRLLFAPGAFPFVIGSLEYGVDGYIDDESVSRFHAKLDWDGDTYFIQDLNSEQGTFINEKQLMPEGKYPIAFGDRVRFGGVIFTLMHKK